MRTPILPPDTAEAAAAKTILAPVRGEFPNIWWWVSNHGIMVKLPYVERLVEITEGIPGRRWSDHNKSSNYPLSSASEILAAAPEIQAIYTAHVQEILDASLAKSVKLQAEAAERFEKTGRFAKTL